MEWHFGHTPRVELDEQLAKFIRARRGEKNYEEFGRLIGCSGSTVHRLENRNQNFTRELLNKLKQTFRCTLADIFPHEFNGHNGNGTRPVRLQRPLAAFPAACSGTAESSARAAGSTFGAAE
ncbi:MAG: hypothetical protein PCFJNLEI_02289 [Verrucomicrobiae bacterium]|nr:hypothetical protein [Verrucomicrobiae bacterium]